MRLMDAVSHGLCCPFVILAKSSNIFPIFPIATPKADLPSPPGILQGLDTRILPAVNPSFPLANEEMYQYLFPLR